MRKAKPKNVPPPGKYQVPPTDTFKIKAPNVGFGKAIRSTIFPAEKVTKPEVAPSDAGGSFVIA